MQKAHPDLGIEVIDVPPDQRESAVGDHELDAAMIHGPVAECPSLAQFPLEPESLEVIMSVDHPLAGTTDSLSLTDLRDSGLVVTRGAQEQVPVAAVIAACQRSGFTPVMYPARASVSTEVATSDQRWSVVFRSHDTRELTRLGLVRIALQPSITVEATLITRAEEPERALATALHARLAADTRLPT